MVSCWSGLTHLAPNCQSLPTLFSYCETLDHPVNACSKLMQTGMWYETCLISAIAHYFLWCPLFKVQWSLRDAVNFQSCEMDTWCTKINKSPTWSLILRDSYCKFCQVASLGILTATELHLWRFQLEILPRQLPCEHPNKICHLNEDIFDFIYAFIFDWKK